MMFKLNSANGKSSKKTDRSSVKKIPQGYFHHDKRLKSAEDENHSFL